MTNMLKVKLRWTGFQGAPGFSIFYFRDFQEGGGPYEPDATQATAAADKVTAFAQGVTFLLPAGTTLQTETDVEVINDEDGELVNVLQAGPQSAKTSSASAGAIYSGPVGAVINWRTTTVRKGRRIRGRTFIVPLLGSAFEGNGSLASATITGIATAASALAAQNGTPDLGVYARPTRTKQPDGSYIITPDGQWAPVASSSVPDLAAVLRSRRD